MANNESSKGIRRGRPKRDSLPQKIKEGELRGGNYQCTYCSRCFPRQKSVNAHIRTHTGVRPYVCTYPHCERSFVQSGQLKTHVRIHTRQELFMCPMMGCITRYIHHNRRCRKHPNEKLIRDNCATFNRKTESLSVEELEWLERYRSEKENATKKGKSFSPIKSEACDHPHQPSIQIMLGSNKEIMKEVEETLAKKGRSLKLCEIETVEVLLLMNRLNLIPSRFKGCFF